MTNLKNFGRLYDALFDGCWRNYDFEDQIKNIAELLGRGVNINARNSQGETILVCTINRCLME